MPRVAIDLASPDPDQLDVEIAALRGLDVDALLSRWRMVFRRKCE